MTKDILLSISGLHYDMTGIPDEPGAEEENGPIEVITPASYYYKNGKHYIVYDEVLEGMPGTIKTKIRITDSQMVEIMKSGLANTHMTFEKDKIHMTQYETPYGELLVGIHTRNLRLEESEDRIDVNIIYELDVNGEKVADCNIDMQVKSHGKTE